MRCHLPRGLFPTLGFLAETDQLDGFVFGEILLQRGEALGPKPQFLLDAGVGIVWIEQLIQQDQDVKICRLNFDFRIFGHREPGIGTACPHGADSVNVVLFGQGRIEIVDPGFEMVVDADNPLAVLKHNGGFEFRFTYHSLPSTLAETCRGWVSGFSGGRVMIAGLGEGGEGSRIVDPSVEGMEIDIEPGRSGATMPTMSQYQWDTTFTALFERCLERYRSGDTDFNGYYTPADLDFLTEIGCKPRELFDFVEDHAENDGEPSLTTAVLVASVRRDYFRIQMGGVLSSFEISPGSLPPKTAEMEGLVWLPRIIVKARAKLRGELHPEIMYGCGGDRHFLRTHDLAPSDFLRAVWAAEEDDTKILAYVRSKGSRLH